MAAGVLIGKALPQVPDFLGRFEYAQVSIPIAVLIWLMIYPMMMKVDFASVKNVGKNPKGLFVTWAASTPSNWPVWKWVHINTVAPFKSFRSKIRKWKRLNIIRMK